MTLESELFKKYSSQASTKLSLEILEAPDMFYAAAMMKQNEMFFGKGDFTNTIGVLQTTRSPSFKKIGNKLVLLKTGHLYRKGAQININNENDENPGIKMYKDKPEMGINQRLPLYNDKKFDATPENRAVNYKRAFGVWATQIYN